MRGAESRAMRYSALTLIGLATVLCPTISAAQVADAHGDAEHAAAVEVERDDAPSNTPIMVTGVILTALAARGSVVGTALVFRGQTMQCSNEGQPGCAQQGIVTGLGLAIAAGSALTSLVGIPLWVVGQQPDLPSLPGTVVLGVGVGRADVTIAF